MRTKPVVLIFGKSGQVGSALNAELQNIAEVKALSKMDTDLTSESKIRTAIQFHKPGLIVNAAAYTNVEKAEAEYELAHAVNALAPGIMAEEAKKIKARLIHYSTDYVFDGKKSTPYTEEDACHPINVYGRSKWLGEKNVFAATDRAVILRTSWVYGHGENNFVSKILRLSRQKDELKVVADQIGAPTSAGAIAKATKKIIERLLSEDDVSGLYHLTASGSCSWFEFADYILEKDPSKHEQKCKKILPVATSEYPSALKRPLNSRLSNEKLKKIFQIELPSWQTQLQKMLGRPE